MCSRLPCLNLVMYLIFAYCVPTEKECGEDPKDLERRGGKRV